MNSPDLFDALLGKLEKISLVWGETFAATPAIDVPGYRRLQRVVNDYGERVVREAFEWAIDRQLAPDAKTAVPLTVALCKAVKRREAESATHTS